jgi:excisionase family DNA binding protein
MRTDLQPAPARGMTPAEVGRYLRVSPDYVRDEIRSGRLGAIDTRRHRCRRPRYIVLPHHLAAWEQSRAAATPAAPSPRRRRRPPIHDYYPD